MSLQNSINSQHRYELSIVVVTYNSSFEKIKKTIDSALIQKDISFEIIIADDGSKDSHQDEIISLFKTNRFKDYKIILNKENSGTVKNYISGLENAEGFYTKGISPGDCFINDNVLRKWIDFNNESNFEWSFSDAVYYSALDGNPLCSTAYPNDISPYTKNNMNEIRWNYVVLRDIALGAAILGKTSLQLEYCKNISEHGVKFAEDNIWRLMMFDGIVGMYYPKMTIFYEFGEGISTSKNASWSERIATDRKITDAMMIAHDNPDNFQKKMIKEIGLNRTGMSKLVVKGALKHYLKCRFFMRKTKVAFGG